MRWLLKPWHVGVAIAALWCLPAHAQEPSACEAQAKAVAANFNELVTNLERDLVAAQGARDKCLADRPGNPPPGVDQARLEQLEAERIRLRDRLDQSELRGQQLERNIQILNQKLGAVTQQLAAAQKSLKDSAAKAYRCIAVDIDEEKKRARALVSKQISTTELVADLEGRGYAIPRDAIQVVGIAACMNSLKDGWAVAGGGRASGGGDGEPALLNYGPEIAALGSLLPDGLDQCREAIGRLDQSQRAQGVVLNQIGVYVRDQGQIRLCEGSRFSDAEDIQPAISNEALANASAFVVLRMP